jgi:hypothetical protein
MPRAAQHDRLTNDFLGWNIKGVHRSMDWAVRIIGPKHQVVMHDSQALKAMEMLYGRKGLIIGAMHILEDLKIIK